MTAALDAAGSVPLAVVERCGFPESVHLGAAVVVGPGGAVLAQRGDIRAAVYPRSALKPFQTVAALRAGARLDAQGLAIVTSSHAGTSRHIAAVRAVLAAHGLDESHLRTPVAWPMSGTAARALAADGGGPNRIAMNCSGNHAGMLAGACAAGWAVDDYLAEHHPIHRLAAQVIAEHASVSPTARGVDGCGGPVWALPLVALARGYGRVAAGNPDLIASVLADPELVEGAGMPTTRAIEATGVFGKSGAEGVWCAVAPDGAAAAVKVLDGSARAAPAIAIALLAEAGALMPDAAGRYLEDPSLSILGGGAEVGRIRVLP